MPVTDVDKFFNTKLCRAGGDVYKIVGES